MNLHTLCTLSLLATVGSCAESDRSVSPKTPECLAGDPNENLPTSGPGDTLTGARIVGQVATTPGRAIEKGAVVYLEDAPRQPNVGLAAAVDNRNMTFAPFLSVITTGGSVTFTNTDPLVHNVFSPDNEKWDVGNLTQNGSITKQFNSPGTYTLLCNMHQNMLAYLVVSPSSYFAKTTRSGKYAIGALPPGTYKATAWAPRLAPQTRSVTVGANGDTVVDFTLSAPDR